MITELAHSSVLGTLVTCPYCGHQQYHETEVPAGHGLLVCDVENGGCDRYFAIFWQAKVEVRSCKVEVADPIL